MVKKREVLKGKRFEVRNKLLMLFVMGVFVFVLMGGSVEGVPFGQCNKDDNTYNLYDTAVFGRGICNAAIQIGNWALCNNQYRYDSCSDTSVVPNKITEYYCQRPCALGDSCLKFVAPSCPQDKKYCITQNVPIYSHTSSKCVQWCF